MNHCKRKYILKIIVPLLIAITGIVCIYFFVIKKTENSDIIPSGFIIPEYKIDSVLSQLSETEKLGLLLFVRADVNDSTDYNNLLNNTRNFGLSSWLISVNSFDYHKQHSNILMQMCTAPGTYAYQWDNNTPESGQLPPFHLLSSITDSSFLLRFSELYADILKTYGINCVFIPQIFKDTLQEVPQMPHLNNLISSVMSVFNSKNFCSPTIVFNAGSGLIQFKDTLLSFPGDLLGMIIEKHGFSAFSYKENISVSHSLNILNVSNTSDIENFISSPFNMLLVEVDKTQETFDFLQKLYSENTNKAEIDKKLKQIIEVKLMQRDFSSGQQSQAVSVESTLWKTILMQLSERIACLKKNENNQLPLYDLKANYIVAKDLQIPEFHAVMKSVFPEYAYTISRTDTQSVSAIIDKLRSNKLPFVIIQNRQHRFAFDKNQLDSLYTQHTLILLDFSENTNNALDVCFQSILVLKHNSEVFQRTAAGVLTGSTNVSGLVESENPQNAFMYSHQFNPVRLKFSYPEDAGLNGEYLNKTIDSLINDAIARGAFPGCQVFTAKEGKIVLNKAYGSHSYDKIQSVKITDLYDVASVTKIAAATVAAMRMYEQGKLSLNETMRKYFRDTEINYTRIKPDTNVIIDTLNLKVVNLEKLILEKKLPKDTIRIQDTLLVTIDSIFSKVTPLLNIFNVPVRYMLMHYSGIAPTLPILPFIQLKKYYLKGKGLSNEDSLSETITIKEIWDIYYTSKKTDSSRVQVADGLYLKDRWMDSLWQRTKEVGVSGRKYSQYTDLNMILVQMTIDTINKTNLYQYLKKEIYGPLGLKNTMYRPLDQGVSRSRIAPTEFDMNWRKQLLQGHVHDPYAAVIGGISGNAGLFASAEDLGILFQMLLNGGTYGGKRFLSEKTIKLFTATNPETGRGLGFDKYSPNNIVAPSASKNTFGHTGFTGCCVWVDPDNQLVFVFLSNRVHPNVRNYKINTLKVRQKVHQALYDAEIKY